MGLCNRDGNPTVRSRSSREHRLAVGRIERLDVWRPHYRACLRYRYRSSNLPGRGGGNAWDRLAIARRRRSLSLDQLAHADHEPVDRCRRSRARGPQPAGTSLHRVHRLRRSDRVSPAVCRRPDRCVGQSDPPTVSLATARGNVNHIALAYLCHHVGVDPRRVSIRVFDSARHAIADALESPQGIAAVSAASLVPEVEAGSIRVLASSAPKRLGDPLGAIPTWTELGVDCSIGTWRGVVGPPKLAADVVSFWDAAISSAMTTPAWQTALSEHNWTDSFLSSSATQQFMREEEIRMGEALRSLDLG